MANWIGETSGFIMLLLIGTLFLVMLKEFHLLENKRFVEFRTIAIYTIMSGFAYLSMGGFIYNVSINSSGAFEYNKVWNYGNYAKIMAGVESGVCEGLFNSLYIKVSNLAGRIFFSQYLSATIYISFLLAIIFAIIVYAIESRLFGEGMAEKLLPFTYVWPFSFKLFLPSPVSFICCLSAGMIFCVLYAGKGKQHIKINILNTGWSYQFILSILCAANIMIYYMELVGRK